MDKSKIEQNKTPASIYLMHKYWGKKPSKDLKDIILKYSKEKDTILDPFAGYGGIAIEGTLLNRNVIINDLNPAANFISASVLEKDINIDKLIALFNEIKDEYKLMEKEWYENDNGEIYTTLRNKDDLPLKNKEKNSKNVMEIYELSEMEKNTLIKKENSFNNICWYPTDKLIKNSRISAKENMKVCDLFPKRALICQAFLFDIINKLDESKEKELLKFAFTSNLAN